MDSLTKLYRIGNGPSSSHTMGPKNAASIFLNNNLDADHFVVKLYGSLAATGKGHLTDKVIIDALGEKTIVFFNPEVIKPLHNNALEFFAYDKEDKLINNWLVYSVGGGEISDGNNLIVTRDDVYPETSMKEVLAYCEEKKLSLYQYVINHDKRIMHYLGDVFNTMVTCVEKGLSSNNVLPGPLKIKRRANEAYNKYLVNRDLDTLIFASALAASEENASGGIVATAPTCGSCGVIPGIIYAYFRTGLYPKEKICEGLAVAGIVGNLAKTNASISGAEVGCQGEVGVACSMGAALVAYLKGGTNEQIEYAAEIALEHHLGMTCDPIQGYVQIPCIERNALSSKTAISCAEYALLTNGEHYISLDNVIESMKETGKDLKREYKETAIGGLAKKGIDLNEE